MSARERLLGMQPPSSWDNTQNFTCSYLPWDPAVVRQSGLELCVESLRFVALEKELKGQLLGSLCSVIPPSFSYCKSHLFQAEHFPPCSINLEGGNNPTYRNLLLTHPVELKT